MTLSTARLLARLTALGVTGYVGSWLVAGWWTTDHDPRTQAISELFALGAPAGPRILVSVALVVTGAMLVAFGPALDRLLPGSGRAAPLTAMVSGVATMLVPVVPCTPGCPGFGTTALDTLHLVAAAVGYLTLIATPLLVAHRVRDHDPVLARLSLVVGVVAAIGFAVGASALFTGVGGWIQRGYNTTADLWYVVAGWWLTRRPTPDRTPTTVGHPTS